MTTHVKVLGVLFIAFSAITLLVALFLLLAIGGAAGIVGMTAPPEDAAIAIPVLGIAGTTLSRTPLTDSATSSAVRFWRRS